MTFSAANRGLVPADLALAGLEAIVDGGGAKIIARRRGARRISPRWRRRWRPRGWKRPRSRRCSTVARRSRRSTTRACASPDRLSRNAARAARGHPFAHLCAGGRADGALLTKIRGRRAVRRIMRGARASCARDFSIASFSNDDPRPKQTRHDRRAAPRRFQGGWNDRCTYSRDQGPGRRHEPAAPHHGGDRGNAGEQGHRRHRHHRRAGRRARHRVRTRRGCA